METKPKGKGDTGGQPLSGQTLLFRRFQKLRLDNMNYPYSADERQAFGVPQSQGPQLRNTNGDVECH